MHVFEPLIFSPLLKFIFVVAQRMQSTGEGSRAMRRRVTYVDGFPVGDPEIVFKYRHPDEHAATAVNVHPKIAGKYEVKFKAEVLPLKDQVGGYRILYSHNCQFGISQVHEADRTSMATLAEFSPRWLF
jgi:hypothetical protein